MQIEDRGGHGYAALYQETQNLVMKAWQTPGLTGLFSGFQVNVPQLYVDVDREKAKAQGVDLDDTLRHDADLPRLALRERLQPLRPHLPGDGAGRLRLPPAAGRHR